MKLFDLCENWEGRCLYPNGTSFTYAAALPGCAIGDLIRASKLPEDLLCEKNAEAVLPFEACDYVYTKRFTLAGDTARAVLHFERIDTYADVLLNGATIYHSENGNIAHDIPLGTHLLEGENLLEVRLYSPIRAVEGKPARKGAFTTERLHTRRMQCTYGWDWVARFVTCGLGKCYITTYEQDEIAAPYVYIATLFADAECAQVRVDLSFDTPYRGRVLTLAVRSPEGTEVLRTSKYCEEDLVRLDLDIPAPALWWPLGYGAQPLYTLELFDGEQMLYTEKFGIRTVTIMQLPDAPDSENAKLARAIHNPKYDQNEAFSGFVLKVNGVRIFCRGANWVPCFPYTVADTKQKQTELLELCAKAGVNMLRVWGGGAFEERHFYDECSRLGITVTQDFLMACGHYPEEEEWFIKELQKEALYAARALRNQPCLMWWSGDNENAVKGCDTDTDYQGRRSAFAGIAPVLYREDPYRRFLPSSPYGGKMYASNTVGTTHNTQFLSQLFPFLLEGDLTLYKERFKDFRARFIAEEPQLGAASPVSLRRFMSEQDILTGDDMWLYHTKGNPGLAHELWEYLLAFTEHLLGDFTDGADRLFKLRYVQYEWVRLVMETARREKDFCSGIIFWMMNDCWPAAAGWSLIDYYNLPKEGYYAFARCAKDTLCSFDCEGSAVTLHLSHNGRSDVNINGRILSLAKDGVSVREICSFSQTLGADSACVAATLPLPLAGETLICDIESENGQDRAFYRSGALAIRQASVQIVEGAHCVTVTASEYVHAVMLTGEAVFEDNCFSLLPGEARCISYRPLGDTEAPVTVEAYTLA